VPSPRAALSAVALSFALATLPAAPFVGAPTSAAEPTAEEITRVVVISVDGLNPDAIRRLGRDRAPTFHRLVREGATTYNARTAVEKTSTLPNHTGMVTSRRIDRAKGGHGVTWNDDRLSPRTVQRAAGHAVGSVFSSLNGAGLDSAVFAAKAKFSLFERSWPQGIDRSLIKGDNVGLVRSVKRDLARHWRALTFLHLSLPDVAGHAHGWMSPAYLDAVRRSDALIGKVLNTVTRTTESSDHTLVIVTSDHGGLGAGHGDPRRYADYRVPFLVWGPGVAAGADLYDLNPTYADPGRRRIGYGAERQPVRNGDVANLVLDMLGLPAIPHSELNAEQDLEVLDAPPAG
jgi:predicted AlkP superfamily pyrophosphatase or phosphodiesterase